MEGDCACKDQLTQDEVGEWSVVIRVQWKKSVSEYFGRRSIGHDCFRGYVLNFLILQLVLENVYFRSHVSKAHIEAGGSVAALSYKCRQW